MSEQVVKQNKIHVGPYVMAQKPTTDNTFQKYAEYRLSEVNGRLICPLSKSGYDIWFGDSTDGNDHMLRFDPSKACPFDLSFCVEDMDKQLMNFTHRFANEIFVLESIYGETNVQVLWGIIYLKLEE